MSWILDYTVMDQAWQNTNMYMTICEAAGEVVMQPATSDDKERWFDRSTFNNFTMYQNFVSNSNKK